VDTGVVIITTTFPAEDIAQELARDIIESKLAACVHILPVTSFYRWEGRLNEDAEYLLVAKTAAVTADALVAFLKSRHPYDLPELLVTPVIGGDTGYLEWVRNDSAPEMNE
jgi:periplasmic divalent cation tolerance protein